jgi:hypothetical protein
MVIRPVVRGGGWSPVRFTIGWYSSKDGSRSIATGPQPLLRALPQPKDRRALSHLTHGFAGSRIYLFTDGEQQAYDDLCRNLTYSLAPVGEAETQIVKQLCEDRWRLQRAARFESAIFAERAARFSADPGNSTGDRSSIPVSRTANPGSPLRRLQAERKAVREAAIAEAALLAQLAESKGERCDTSEPSRTASLNFQPPRSPA